MTITRIPNWQKDVFSEGTLSAVVRVSWGVVGSKGDFWLAFGFAVAGIALSAFSVFVWQNTAPPSVIARMMQSWSVVAGGFAAAILGFLIAGFSIFAAMTEKELFHGLAQIKSGSRNISDFKFIFYNFLYVFIQYLLFSFLCLFVCFLFVDGSPVWYLASIAYGLDHYVVKFVVLSLAVVFGSYAIYMILLLRSFIWSMYQSLLFAIFADA